VPTGVLAVVAIAVVDGVPVAGVSIIGTVNVTDGSGRPPMVVLVAAGMATRCAPMGDAERVEAYVAARVVVYVATGKAKQSNESVCPTADRRKTRTFRVAVLFYKP